MNASCGMDFCLSEGLANNDHTNEVLFCENFNHGTLPAPSAIDFVILQQAVLFTAMMTGWYHLRVPGMRPRLCSGGDAVPQTQPSWTLNRTLDAPKAWFRSPKFNLDSLFQPTLQSPFCLYHLNVRDGYKSFKYISQASSYCTTSAAEWDDFVIHNICLNKQTCFSMWVERFLVCVTAAVIHLRLSLSLPLSKMLRHVVWTSHLAIF